MTRLPNEETSDPVVVSIAQEESDGTLGSKTAIAAVVLAGIAAFLNLYATQPILPMLEQLYSASKSQIGMTVSGATLGVALSAPFMGTLAERIGRRRVILASVFLLAFPTLLAATSPSLQMLIVWRFLQGAIVPGIFGVTIAYIAEEWSAAVIARVMSLYVSGTVLGGFLGRVLTGFAATHALLPHVVPSWRVGFVVIAVCDLIFGACIARWLPPDTSNVRHHALDTRFAVLQHLKNRKLLATYAIGFSVLFALVATFTYITFHLAGAPYRLTPSQLSWLFVVYLIGLFVTPIAGRWIGRVGSRRTLFFAVAASMVGVSITLLHSIPFILLGLVLCSSGVFVCQAAATSYIQHAAPSGGRASAAGLYVSFYYIGGSVAGVLPALFWNYGAWSACVVLVLIVQVLTIVIAASAWNE